jgi:hypothetical protein
VSGRHSKRRRVTRRLLTAASLVATFAAVASMVTGLTFALESATSPTQTSRFSVATVTVGLGTGTAVQCTIANLAPGDASSSYPSGPGVANQSFAQCRYFVKYTGTAAAYLALDVAVANSGTPLYNGSATGLQLLVQDTNGTTYVGGAPGEGGTSYTAEGGPSFATTLSSGATASDLLVSTSSQTGSPTAFTDEFTIDYWMAIPSANTNIGGTTTVTLTFHAVQAGNGALPGGCSAAGTSCTGLSWS